MELSELDIFHVVSDGTAWATFLKEKLREVGIISQTKDLDSNCGNVYTNNVVLATPAILELKTVDHIKEMDTNTSLMVLLGVDENDLKKVLLRLQYNDISEWTFFRVEQTEESVNTLIERIRSLLKNARFSKTMPEYDTLPAPRASMPELRHVAFSRVLSTPELRTATTNHDGVIDVYILSTRKGSDELQINFHGKEDQHCVQAVFLDKALYRLQLPENYNIDTESSFLAVDGKSLNEKGVIPPMSYTVNTEKDLEMIKDIFGHEDNPVSLICRVFGLSDIAKMDVDLLDEHLSQKCKKFSLDNPEDSKSSLLADIGCKKWPTLLHFCAEYNLKLFAAELLRIPCSIDVCFSMNIEKETPQMIASRNGFIEFTQMIKSFIKVSNLLGRTASNKDSGVFDEGKLETIQEHNRRQMEPSLAVHYDESSTEKVKTNKAESRLLDKWLEKMKKGNSKKMASLFSTTEDVLREPSKEGSKDKAAKHLHQGKSVTLPVTKKNY